MKKEIMLKQFLVFVFLTSAVQLAHAVYKCGNTYSQTPCATDARKIELQAEQISGNSVAPNTSPAQIEQSMKLCERALREVPNWKDRESLKLSPIKRLPKTMVAEIKGQKREVILYTSNINGKNSYGAYQGEKIAACYFDLKDEKFLDYLVGS